MAISDEVRRNLKESYLEDPYLNLHDLAKSSKDICGIGVSYEVIKTMSWTDGWGVEKRRIQLGKSGLPKDMSDEADDMRSIVYAQIMDPELKHSPMDLSQLIRTWDTIRTASPRKSSGKSSRQQVIEATKQAALNVRELRKKRENARTNP